VAVSGDVVLLAEGVHYEPDVVDINAGVRLCGAGTYETVQVRIDGIDVNWSADGDSLWTVIENIHFESVGDVNPILRVKGNPFTIVRNCQFYTDETIKFYGGGRFEHNLVIKEDVEDEGLSLRVNQSPWGVPGELYIAWNEFLLGPRGFQVEARGWVTRFNFHHNTVVYPYFPDGWFPSMSGIDYGGGEFEVSSNIFWGTELACSDYWELGGSLAFDYNCFWLWLTDPTYPCDFGHSDFEADPLFCDFGTPWSWDWRLRPDSPCVGAGEGGTNIGAHGVGCGALDVTFPGDPSVVVPLRVAPNPASGSVEVAFTLPTPSDVVLRVFDVVGREVWRPFEGWLAAGPQTLSWDARQAGLRSGLYFVRMESGDWSTTARLLLVR
jgi:hypothetical protein